MGWYINKNGVYGPVERTNTYDYTRRPEEIFALRRPDLNCWLAIIHPFHSTSTTSTIDTLKLQTGTSRRSNPVQRLPSRLSELVTQSETLRYFSHRYSVEERLKLRKKGSKIVFSMAIVLKVSSACASWKYAMCSSISRSCPTLNVRLRSLKGT